MALCMYTCLCDAVRTTVPSACAVVVDGENKGRLAVGQGFADPEQLLAGTVMCHQNRFVQHHVDSSDQGSAKQGSFC